MTESTLKQPKLNEVEPINGRLPLTPKHKSLPFKFTCKHTLTPNALVQYSWFLAKIFS